jgi:hypothetical protein
MVNRLVRTFVIARAAQQSEAIHPRALHPLVDCFAPATPALAMTKRERQAHSFEFAIS